MSQTCSAKYLKATQMCSPVGMISDGGSWNVIRLGSSMHQPQTPAPSVSQSSALPVVGSITEE